MIVQVNEEMSDREGEIDAKGYTQKADTNEGRYLLFHLVSHKQKPLKVLHLLNFTTSECRWENYVIPVNKKVPARRKEEEENLYPTLHTEQLTTPFPFSPYNTL